MAAVVTAFLMLVAGVAAQQKTFVDPNVNMVKGTTFPAGDPYLQRQNEPSIAVSTRNPCHLVAGANDYRSVDIPFDDTIPPNTENNLSLAGDAWVGIFKSFDCGAKWVSTLLPGYPQDTSHLAPELEGHAAGADPTVRAGTNGLFYYSGMVFNRGSQGTSKIFVARLIDNNNKERGDPIEFDGVSIVDTGTKGQFLDKPWMVVDVPRTGYGPGSTLGGGATCSVKGQTLPAGNVYMAWAKFTGSGNQHSKLMFARSSDCGKTWKQHPISNNQSLSQGANLAVAPHDGTLYLTWREFAGNGANKLVNFWIVTSSDGGDSWTAAKKIGSNVTTFDQLRTTSTFRSNALPAITADHENRVYVAWSARGYAMAPNANGVLTPNEDARIMMVVSTNRGQTWSDPFPIDPNPARGHQLMPSLAFASGKIQAIWYDAREDVSGVWGKFIDDAQATNLLHTIEVRGAQATPGFPLVFGTANELSQEISKYRKWNIEVFGDPLHPEKVTGYVSKEIGSNPPNLPMYANGTTPFIGDYIDVSGLPSFPVQTSSGQVWQPNVGPLNFGTAAANLSTSGFPTLASFHATWTDNRDVSTVCTVTSAGQMVGQRNANIYTARLTQGLYVGSPGNTKPFGYRLNPKTNQQELIQRGFVVFAQNTTDTLKFYRFKIETQPAGGRASLKQFDHNGPLTEVIVSVPAASTVARTVYATSTDVNAQLLVNIEQMDHDAGTVVTENGVTKKVFAWVPLVGGLHGSVLLNPDRTNPVILDPDVLGDVPEIATDEVHNPSMFDAQFFQRTTKSNKLDVLNAATPDPENPDPENPDPENPDPENPDPENPDPENPDPENPDPENPDPENPDPENPDPENSLLINSTISDEDLENATITDIQWKVHNSGNTTSAYKFRPSLPKTFTDQRYQLIVTRRSMALALGADCTPSWKSTNQVLSNIVNFQPKTPDPENPDPENPDPENPDPENPDPENPDPENANFFLAPEETATITLRVFDLDKTNNEEPPKKREDVAAKTAAEAANTGETTVSTAVAGPDLTLFDTPATVSPAIARPGKQVTVTFTLSNRGTGSAVATLPAEIRTKVYISADQILDEEDDLVATVVEPSPFVHCTDPNDAANVLACSTPSSVNVIAPQLPGTSYAIIVTDEDGFVFEADELNNRVVVPIVVANYQLTFAQQPSATTQDFTMTPAVVVAVTHPDGGSVNAADVAGVTLAIANNPSAGTLTGTLFQPNSGVIGANTAFADLKINNAGNGYTLLATAPFSNPATSAAFNIETDLPPVTVNDSYTTNEEQALSPAAPGVLTNDSDPATNGTKPAAYVFDAVKETDPANGSLIVNANGSFTYTPNPNFAGTDSFTYRARDGRPGNTTIGTASIAVVAVNDVPSFTAGANQSVIEDSGAHSVPNWATGISKGPANESGQVVDFIVTNDNAALFSAQPAVAPDGTLTFTGAANQEGVATVTVRIHDNGGILNGGVDTSEPQTFTITITGDNDPPVAAADSYSTNEDAEFGVDAGDPVNNHYLNGLLANDSDPDGNLLVVEYLTTTSNGTLLPHANGSFSYTPNANFFGTDSFTYRAFDGETTGNTVTVTITVNSKNDAPSFTKGINVVAPAGTGVNTIPGWATAISAGPANEAAQTLNFIVSNNNNGIFGVQPAIAANGTLTFTPKQNQTGTATVTVQLHDNGGVANGGVDTSAAQTFTITISNAAATYIVTNVNDSGIGSLREALVNANANSSLDTIAFNIPGAGVHTITPLSPLPAIVFAVTIDGTTQPGFIGSPLIELNGSSAGAGAGLSAAAASVTIRSLAITQFQGAGIEVSGATANARLTQNAITNNLGLGIDLLPAGVNANDALDADLGPNGLQNFPIVTGAYVNGGSSTFVTGTIASAANTAYTIELFTNVAADPSNYGEGHVFRHSFAVTTDGAGNGSFAVTLPVAFTLGSFVTATATDPSGNTSEFSQTRVVVANTPPTTTGDTVLTVTDFGMTTSPAANDLDPDVAAPEVRTTYRPVANSLLGPGAVAVVTSTGLGYFTGGNQSAGAGGKIGILDLATNTVVGTIPLPGNFAAGFTQVDQSAQLVFFRGGINLLAVDARPASPTFNQLVLNINLGTINSWALDSPHHRLFVTTQTTGVNLLPSGRITVFDTDRGSPNFLKVIAEASVPGANGGIAGAIAVNTVTNKLYVSVTTGSPGLYVVDPATLAMTLIFNPLLNGASNITSIAINDTDNLIYAAGQTALHAVDGITDAKFGQVALGGNSSTGSIDSRMVIHRGTGRVYVRLGAFPNASNLVVVDGKRGSATINTVKATINLGRENGSAFMAVDETADRLIATSATDLRSHIIDTTSNLIVGTIMATQIAGRVSLDPTTSRAYLTAAGYIKVVDLATAAQVTDVHVGTQVWGVVVDPLTHSAYVSETGLTTAVKKLNETGISGTITLPHGDGREVYMARNSVTNKIYALNGAATVAGGSDALPGFVHVIDGNTNTVTANVSVGNQPFGIAIDEVNNKIYIGNQSQGSAFPGGISILDGATNAVVQADVSAIPSLSTPPLISVGRDMVVTTSGRLYFRVIGGATTQLLGTMTGTTATSINLGNVNVNIIRYNPVTNRLYVGATSVGNSANQIFVIDPATNNIVTTLNLGVPSNFITTQSYIAVNTATNRLFIADFDDMQLSVVDGATYAVVATIPMPFGPSTVAVDEVHNRIYVGNAIARSLTIVDGATLRVARNLALPIAPVALYVDSSLSPARIFAFAIESEGAISVVDDPGTAAPQVTSVTQGAHGTVVLNADGSVTYTSASGYVGNDSYTYTTTDGQGGSTVGTANVTVYAELSIQPATLANGFVGQNYSQTLTTTGGSGAPVVWTVSGFLPGGLHLSSTGVLSGKALQSGTFTFTVNARDTGQDLLSESKTYTVIVGPPVITPTGIPSATVNVPYSTQLVAGGATGAVTWSLNTNGHPALNWLSISNTGVLSGTPATYGTTPSFTVTATDSATPTAQVATRTYTTFVGGPLTMADLREGIVLETEPSVSFLGGNGTRGLTMTSGALPPGIVLGTGGVFTGTPTRHGTYNFTLELKDCLNSSCSGNVTQQTVNKNIAWRVSAKDQQGSSFSGGPSLVIGGSPNRKVAQVFTVGAQGSLTAIGLQSMTCAVTQTTVTVDIQRLTAAGLPDGTTIATGSAQANFNAIALSPAVPVAIGERLAFIASVGGPLTCSITNSAAFDSYQAGDGYIATTGAWSKLSDADVDNNGTVDGIIDFPSFRTLITPALDVTYLPTSHGGNFVVALNNGLVLIGGHNSNKNVELYDPATNTTTATGPMSITRQNATATLLGDGTVLVAGGRDDAGNRRATAEIYDPVTGTFSPTNGNLSNARENHRAVRYVVGGVEKVLITGGVNPSGSTLALAEIYDPVAKTFSNVQFNELLARQSHVAVLMNNGRILIAGGYTSGSGPNAEIFNPNNNLFTATGNMQVPSRGLATATLLNDGRVLIAGGQSTDVRAEAELYDPTTGLFTATASMSTPRYQHTATLLNDGTVLVAGGHAAQSISSWTLPQAAMERFNPGTNSWVSAGSMETRRAAFAAAKIVSGASAGKVLLAGGFSQSWMTGNTGELFDLANTPAFSPTTLPNAAPSTPYNVALTPTGGSGAPYTFTKVAGTLPAGVSLLSNTLTGTPAANSTGLYTFAIRLEDSAQHAIVQTLTLQVGTVNTITTPYRLPDAWQNQPYSQLLAATGPGNVWSVLPTTSGSSTTNPLPTGLGLSSQGVIGGNASSLGNFNFGVRAVDANGVEAIKVLAINVVSALQITTTTLTNPELFNTMGCISTSGGSGTRTYSIVSGALPSGVTLSGTNNCFQGQVKATGPFTFRVRVTDQTFNNPQTAEQTYNISVYAADQQNGFNGSSNGYNFGAGTGTKLAERVITGITGTLRGVRMQGLTCQSNPTNVSVEIQGLDAAGKPNGTVLATGNAASPLGSIYLNTGVFFTADEPFAIVFDAGASCNLRPLTFDSSPGDGFISNGGGAWQRLNDFDATHTQYDVPFTSLVEPVAGLAGMNNWRGNFTETLLGNGKVLLAGGECCGPNGTAELFDPATNTTTATGNMTVLRQSHTATLLPNGKVLLTGGTRCVTAPPNQFCTTEYQASAELYNPATNTFTATGSMASSRAQHRATLLLDGKVLITGGFGGAGNGTTLNSAEIYDPNAGTFTPVPVNMGWARQNHTATLLGDGRVLIAAGYGGGSSAEVYNPGTQTFAVTSTNLQTSRGRHTATLLDSGKVLITGGTGGVGGEALSSADLYDPNAGANGSFSAAGNMVTPRIDHTAVKISDGSVVIVGGYADSTCCYPHPPTAVVERYVPGTGFVNAGTTIAARFAHTATAMSNDKVLVAGTFGWSSAAGRTAEMFDAVSPYLQAAQVTGASGSPLNFTLQPAGGSGSGYTMTLLSGTLPTGNNMQLNLSNGQLTGTPNQSGTFRLTIKIVDGAGHTSYQLFTLNIDPITITTTSLPTAYQGVDYPGALSATGVGTITWQIVGFSQPPPGLTLNQSTGEFDGAPTGNCCYYSLTVRATDSQGQTAQKTLAISVQTPMTISNVTLGDGLAGSQYYGSLFTNGGTGPFNWSISGQPVGLQINSSTGGFLNSYPADVLRQSGTFTIAAQVTDSSNPAQNASKNLTLNVYAQDQATGSWMGLPDINFDPPRKIAQVYRSGTPYGISGVQVFQLQCDAGVVLTGKVYPVTAVDMPDTSGSPLRTATLTSNQFGYFDSPNLIFSPSVSMNTTTKFAVVYSTNGHCVQKDWPQVNYYSWAKAWIDDGSGWTESFTAIGREDLPHVTLVQTDASLRFLAGWRGGHAAAKLNDGRVFLAGSDQYTEVYNPATLDLTLTANMSHARQEPTATVLAGGKVLVAGGQFWDDHGDQDPQNDETVAAATTQRFNPATGLFESSQNMSVGRMKHTATRLNNGNVLIAGGRYLVNNIYNESDTADLFDGSGNFITTLTMQRQRAEHTATLLADGRVLLVGGWGNGAGPVAEIYDPTSGPNGSFSGVSASINWPSQHTATLLTTGPNANKVLIAGGWGFPTLGGNYLFDPSDNSFTSFGSMLTPRLDHTANMLPDGRIVFAGGVVDTSNWTSTALVEIYDPVTGAQTYIGYLIAERNSHSADVVTTPGGLRLAVAAGYGHSALTGQTIELFVLPQ